MLIVISPKKTFFMLIIDCQSLSDTEATKSRSLVQLQRGQEKKKIICPTDAFFYDHSKNETISGVLDLESQCLEWVSKEVSRIFQVRAQYRTLFFHLLSYWKVSGEKYH